MTQKVRCLIVCPNSGPFAGVLPRPRLVRAFLSLSLVSLSLSWLAVAKLGGNMVGEEVGARGASGGGP
jgi:hypothetical protein